MFVTITIFFPFADDDALTHDATANAKEMNETENLNPSIESSESDAEMDFDEGKHKL